MKCEPYVGANISEPSPTLVSTQKLRRHKSDEWRTMQQTLLQRTEYKKCQFQKFHSTSPAWSDSQNLQQTNGTMTHNHIQNFHSLPKAGPTFSNHGHSEFLTGVKFCRGFYICECPILMVLWATHSEKINLCRVPRSSTRQICICREHGVCRERQSAESLFAECPAKFSPRTPGHLANIRFPVVDLIFIILALHSA